MKRPQTRLERFLRRLDVRLLSMLTPERKHFTSSRKEVDKAIERQVTVIKREHHGV